MWDRGMLDDLLYWIRLICFGWCYIGRDEVHIETFKNQICRRLMRFRDMTLLTLLSMIFINFSWEALRSSSFLTTNENSFNFTPCCPVRYSFSFRIDISLSNSLHVLGWLSRSSSTLPFNFYSESLPPLKTSRSKTSVPSARARASRMIVKRFWSLMRGSERSCSWWPARSGCSGTCK